MRTFLTTYFQIREHRSTIRRELVAGVTTFLTVAYIIIVNPAILEAAGIPKGPSTVATIVSAALGTLLMGLYAPQWSPPCSAPPPLAPSSNRPPASKLAAAPASRPW